MGMRLGDFGALLRRNVRVQTTQLARVLRGVPLFRDLPDRDLADIWRRLVEVRLGAGAMVCSRGEPGGRFYVVKEGEAEVSLGLGPGGLSIRRLGAGDFFGEMALLTDDPRSADVTVVQDTVLWALDREDFEVLTHRSPSLLRALNRALCRRLAQATLALEERQTEMDAGGSADTVGGLRFGSYSAIEQIGAGGMGVVYSAVHRQNGTAAAVKILPPAWGDVPELQLRLRREAEVLHRLCHPNVIHVLEMGEVEQRFGGGCYLAMEWLPHSLDRVLRVSGADGVPVEQALALVQGIAEGLHAVHAAGLVHRDVKTSNILLRADGTPALIDFGLVGSTSQAGRASRLTPDNVIVATAAYASPEQVRGEVVDARSDLYSLGVVFYELLTGALPFAEYDPLATLQAHCQQAPPPLPVAMPPEVCTITERLLAKQPEDRYPSAAHLVQTLARLTGMPPLALTT